MRAVEPQHLFFVIWAATQTYADFETQIRAVLGRERMRGADYEEATRLITAMVLGACGLETEERTVAPIPLPTLPRKGGGS
jgi:TetR/AcrR family transcriptional regulator